MQQYQLFLESIRSPETKKVYIIYFKKYVEFMGGEESDLFCGNDPRLIEPKIIEIYFKIEESLITASSNHTQS